MSTQRPTSHWSHDIDDMLDEWEEQGLDVASPRVEYNGVRYKTTMPYESFKFKMMCAIMNKDYTNVNNWCSDNYGHYLRFLAFLDNDMVEESDSY